MLGIPIERIGQTYKLPIDLESQDGPDLSCHCERCEYKKDSEGKVSTNFYYGVLVFPLWIMNVFLYLKSWTLDDQFEFSQQVQEEHRDEITLLQPESITSLGLINGFIGVLWDYFLI
ncbi:hypothetical protein WICANDRAFT_60827 [Wickerhamomyces anomalus NRRL Y-366-8]|uniref:Uncharacterized protein n=1 Tax=Wickerhamomyces anomalus (strain ATCC 58044 / CBS 1984 / NCYC 433 / NRRL Y-366-8) TaxID=683960 RepID=A0A1E3PBM6_WICAA|nr:uncharacterized protein WICANDRAFT_60827 [Wickerhamomyces anomalus NRRL Y-366-8]ODQ62778.1 hypothetical protein WICANDRAFT_60827 [Wickerhamomyces anomalus NRRL Y-366-8]